MYKSRALALLLTLRLPLRGCGDSAQGIWGTIKGVESKSITLGNQSFSQVTVWVTQSFLLRESNWRQPPFISKCFQKNVCDYLRTIQQLHLKKKNQSLSASSSGAEKQRRLQQGVSLEMPQREWTIAWMCSETINHTYTQAVKTILKQDYPRMKYRVRPITGGFETLAAFQAMSDSLNRNLRAGFVEWWQGTANVNTMSGFYFKVR